MKKREFLDLLRFYLRDMPKTVTEDIISDYEEHFAIAAEKGKSEEDICKELGSPELIAKEYISGEKIHLIPVDIDDEMNKDNADKSNDDSKYEDSGYKKTSSKDLKNKKTLSVVIIVLVVLGSICTFYLATILTVVIFVIYGAIDFFILKRRETGVKVLIHVGLVVIAFGIFSLIQNYLYPQEV